MQHANENIELKIKYNIRTLQKIHVCASTWCQLLRCITWEIKVIDINIFALFKVFGVTFLIEYYPEQRYHWSIIPGLYSPARRYSTNANPWISSLARNPFIGCDQMEYRKFAFKHSYTFCRAHILLAWKLHTRKYVKLILNVMTFSFYWNYAPINHSAYNQVCVFNIWTWQWLTTNHHT